MGCPSCGHENRPGAKFCVRCRTPLPRACPRCGTEAAPGDQFCAECGADLPATAVPSAAVGARTDATPASVNPRSYTPVHLAERILAARAGLAGERKQVTVLF